jgi:hypothetical protein
MSSILFNLGLVAAAFLVGALFYRGYLAGLGCPECGSPPGLVSHERQMVDMITRSSSSIEYSA